MMRKIGIGMFCVALCLAVAFIFPQVGTSEEMANSSSCLVCHDFSAGAGDHTKSGHASCASCHEGGIPMAGNVASSTCIVCHPIGDTGECELVILHDPALGGTCLTAGCHDTCAPDDTTTTSTGGDTTTTSQGDSSTTTTTGGCTLEMIYGEGSDEVAVMRYLRDNVLSKSEAGQEIIRLYYMWSPVIARAAQSDDEVKEELKEMVDGILGLVLAEPAKVEKAE